MTDAAKIEINNDRISDTREDDIEPFQKAGLNFDEFLNVRNQYARIDAKEDLKETQKAAMLSSWVNSQNYNAKQKAVI